MAEEVEEAPKKGGSGLIIILLVLVLLLVIGIGVLAFLFLSNSDSSSEPKESQQVSADPRFKVYPLPEPGTPPQYFEMKFVVNFKGEGKAKYLGVDLKIMSRYPGVIEDMEHIRPILLNDLTLLLRLQTFSGINSDDGPEILRAEILNKVRAVSENNGINPELVQDVFLTRIVTQ